jgi:hypothetical protein
MSERKVVKLLICITPEWDAAIRKRLKPFEVRESRLYYGSCLLALASYSPHIFKYILIYLKIIGELKCRKEKLLNY